MTTAKSSRMHRSGCGASSEVARVVVIWLTTVRRFASIASAAANDYVCVRVVVTTALGVREGVTSPVETRS